MSKEKRVAIFVDSRKESGGEYQHLLYTIDNIKKNNNNNIKFLIICLSNKLNLNLKSDDFCLCVEIPINAKKMKQSYTDVPSNERRRIAGKKKVNEFSDGMKILKYMLHRLIKK